MKPFNTIISLVFFVVFLTACAGSPDLSSRDIQVDKSYEGGEVGKIMVISMMADQMHDSRVIIERGFTHQMKAAGIDVVAGYTRFDSLEQLAKEPERFPARLKELGVDAVLFLEATRLDTDYDPAEYDARRSAYRAIGFDNSASVALWSKIAHQASAAKVVMNAGLWKPDREKDLWNANYDINAPNNHDIDNARQYTVWFADHVIADLKRLGFIQ